MNQQREDVELISSILYNNKDKNLSEKELYNRYYRVAYNKVRKYNYDVETAKDIATDIMLKVFGSLEKYDLDKCAFNSWVLRISSNHLIDLYRKNKNQIKFVSYTASVNVNYDSTTTTSIPAFTSNSTFSNSGNYNPLYNLITNNENHEDYFINKEDYNNAISTLTASESNIIKLKFEFGYSNAEIGNMYNVSKSTVSNKINYLKKKIQKNIIV